MTREEALKILKTWKIEGDANHEAFAMAIKALEVADLDGYSSRLWKAAYKRGKA